MDGTQDFLTGGCELAEEPDDVECGLSVKAAGWFVEEQQQIRLRSKLDPDRDSLSSWGIVSIRS